MQNLIRHGVEFLVSKDAAEALKHTSFEWPNGKQAYRSEMKRRFCSMGFSQ